MKHKRILGLVLAAMLVLSQSAGTVWAQQAEAGSAGNPQSASSSAESSQTATTPSAKDEVVYVNLAGDGSVTDVHVVNEFAGGDILDYGNYTNIRNLTTTDEITQDGDKITVSTDEEKLHYQGDLENAGIPWDININYFMDGIEQTAEQAAGMTGHLKMTIDISQNHGCPKNFWEGFALQMTIKMDSDMVENLKADGATVANAGSNKQLTYIILPGKGADLTIEADVTDFHMEAIAINGLRLDLNIDFSADELTSKLDAIEQAAEQLDEGAGQVTEGAEALKDGSEELNSGAQELNAGMTELYSGIETLQAGVNELNDKSEQLTSGSSQVYAALQTIKTELDKVKTTADDLQQLSDASTKVKDGISALVGGLETVDEGIGTFYEALYDAGIDGPEDLVELNNKMLQFVSYTETQKTLFELYESKGGLDGRENAAAVAVMAKLMILVDEGDEEATELYEQYEASGKDKQVIVDYMTQAGTMVMAEKLINADIAYIEGSGLLIGEISNALDEDNEDGLMAGAMTLEEQYAIFDEHIQDLVETLRTLLENMTELKEGINLLVENYGELDAGITEYTNGVAQVVEGCQQLYDGAAVITGGAAALAGGTETLTEGAIALYEGSGVLQDGTDTFADQMQGAGQTAEAAITDTINNMTGANVETSSFVSHKNTNVKSVLFVLKTAPIEEASAPETEEPAEQELTLWQKILNLFGK